jgi:hypothetical protein
LPVRKFHTYLGLLCFGHFLVYGVAGLTATFLPGLERPKVARVVRSVPFDVSRGESDREVADRVYRTLPFPLTRPMPEWYLRHTKDGHLLLDFYNINGIFRVIVLSDEKRLRIEEIQNSSWVFLEDVHAMTAGDGERLTLLRVWGAYNRIAMWGLLGMALTGTWQWAAARKLRSIHGWTGVAVAPVLLMYGVSAVLMTSRAPWLSALKRLHHTAGYWRPDLPSRAWTTVVALTSVALIGLGVTGIAMWWSGGRERRWGLALLAVNLGFVTTLLVLLRRAGP